MRDESRHDGMDVLVDTEPTRNGEINDSSRIPIDGSAKALAVERLRQWPDGILAKRLIERDLAIAEGLRRLFGCIVKPLVAACLRFSSNHRQRQSSHTWSRQMCI